MDITYVPANKDDTSITKSSVLETGLFTIFFSTILPLTSYTE